ncbi:caspase domain-containing protein [Mycena crocata]|nr:caspase domain-containing protein [Mycena crocata]
MIGIKPGAENAPYLIGSCLMDTRHGRWSTVGRVTAAQEQAQDYPCTSESSSSTVTLSSTARKKALLIGICNSESDNYSKLLAAQTDVHKMRELLIDTFDYDPVNITVLTDDGIPNHTQPTRANILLAISELVKDVKEGDYLFFHYCGHSTQVNNSRSNSEEDGKDECLVPLDGEAMMIVDNELHEKLVAPLPSGAHLVAILDTCHSGSLLDLRHYRCNRVPVPWIYRGLRSGEELRNRVVRQGARIFTRVPGVSENAPTPVTQFHSRRSVVSVVRDPQATSRSTSRTPTDGSGAKRFLTRLRTSSIRATSLPDKGNAQDADGHTLPTISASWIFPDADHCDSPAPKFPCNGWCRNHDHRQDDDCVKADVISLASCKDSQKAWENEKGDTMSSLLVGILRQDPALPLRDVLIRISHATYSMALERHLNAKAAHQESKAWEAKVGDVRYAGGAPSFASGNLAHIPRPPQTFWRVEKEKRDRLGYDMDNFQNPELASPRPLDMNRPWRM